MVGAHMNVLSNLFQGGLSGVVLPDILNGAFNTLVVNICLHTVKISVDPDCKNPFLAIL